MERHIRILGILFIVWGALLALFVLIAPLIPMGMRGGMMNQVSILAVLFTLIIAAFYAATGWALLTRQMWARGAAIAASILALFNFPFGTALGVYGLWVTMSEQGRRLFESYRPVSSA